MMVRIRSCTNLLIVLRIITSITIPETCNSFLTTTTRNNIPLKVNLFEQNRRSKSLFFINSAFTTQQTQLYATKQDKKRGIYSRPSAAIEKGSGFFIPGLEGGRVRVAFGLVLIIANIVNNNAGAGAAANAVDYGITEWIGIIFSIILISQGVFESIEERNMLAADDAESSSSSSSSSIDSNSNRIEVVQNSNPSLSSTLSKELRWVGLTIFSFTGTTNFLVWDNTDSLCFTLTSSKSNIISSNDIDQSIIQTSIQSARNSLSTSSTGTISVPNTHPISNIIINNNNDDNNQGIILQRIHYDNSWGILLITDQPMQQAYTKDDFRWLSVLANFIDSFI